MKTSRFVHLAIAAVFVLAMLPASAPVQAQSGGDEITADTQFVPGELVVGFVDGLPVEEMDAKATALAGSVGAQVVKSYANMALLSLSPDADLDAAAEALKAQVGVQYVERNYIRRVPEVARGDHYQVESIERKVGADNSVTIPVEQLKAMRTQVKKNGQIRAIPTYPSNEWQNWGNYRIGHDIVWPEKATSPWVCVADTGVDYKHPDLYPRVVNGYDFINADAMPNDDYGHGTHVAGTIVGKLNSKNGPAGISNGKVLAVKVLGAQGWGTDFDVASGVRYCANNTYVKVINLSLGGGAPSYTSYSALDYAINTKGKLVVAAAGNSYSSLYEYPAAWAYPYVNGPEENGFANDIYQGMLSVGAASPYETWVDTSGDGIKQDDERFADCAAYFSNYGEWVEIVAPGLDIWSTLPVSYPFYGNYYYGDPPKYASWGGTSMATPHVAAAAARLWSINKGLNNAGIHDKLIEFGEPLDTSLAVDPHVVNPEIGYNDMGYNGDAPFCWPNASSPYGLEQDMSAAVYLNLAVAMNRGLIATRAFDATTALPLSGAKVIAVDSNTGVIKDTSVIGPDFDYSWGDLINLPASDIVYDALGNIVSVLPPYYILGINKTGYTYGYQAYSIAYVLPGSDYYDASMGVAAVPPKKANMTVVAQWWHGDDPFGDFGGTGAGDLDLYVWLPPTQNRIIGPEKFGGTYAGLPNPFSEIGTLLAAPYARYYRDGGWAGEYPDVYGGIDYRNIEAIEIKTRNGYAYYPGEYKIYMTNNAGTNTEFNDAWPTVSVWKNGVMLNWSWKSYNVADAGYCNSGEKWWFAGTVSRGKFTPADDCVSRPALPYWVAP